MIDLIHKKCFCGKVQPTYNYIGLIAQYCFNCKLENMVDVKHNLCFCLKARPTFNYKDLDIQKQILDDEINNFDYDIFLKLDSQIYVDHNT